ncbi:phosphotransferase family protein [Ampelomyces quisqualis]|uniref:Phosphotransferase family protein n=1 Tax=Ampelomyces quisqualis TaxID=50730 RepID=A0A6A5QTK9_AMPQU|nr:phosphotransferase family protein [Ampelomyces quisqualis]
MRRFRVDILKPRFLFHACFSPRQDVYTARQTVAYSTGETLQAGKISSDNQDSEHTFYNYTSGRWLYNEPLRLSERRRHFDIHELCQAVAKSVGRSTDEITTFAKIAEGGSYRIFEATFQGEASVIVRLPYPSTIPGEYGIISEVATMKYLRLRGVPIPEVFDWSLSTDNPVQCEYIIMEKVQGKELEHTWYTMTAKERMAVVEKIVDIERMLFESPFPASGSIYFKDSVGSCSNTIDLPLAVNCGKTDGFCIGPSSEFLWWYQRQNELAVNRGPWKTTKELLEAVGHRELTWLQKFGKRRFPREPLYREFYGRQEVDPQVQVDSLMDYLKVAPHIIPDNLELCQPTIRHPDLSPTNIFVSESGDITGVIDWQHSTILPMFLQAKIPKYFQNYGDDESENFRRPKLRADFDSLEESEKASELELYRRRQLHYFYLGFTSTNNKPHFHAMGKHDLIVRNRLYDTAGRPWEGDNTSLKAAIVQTSTYWPDIATSAMKEANFPVKYPDTDVANCLHIDAKQKIADAQMQQLCDFIGVNIDGWVPPDSYEEAREKEQYIKQQMLEAAETEHERKELDEHWPFQDHDELD